MHGAEMILLCGVAETQEDKKHHDERWNHLCFIWKEDQYTIKEVDYPTIIENRRISMQMSSPVSTRQCNNHLKNNNGKLDDNILRKKIMKQK